MEGRAPAHSQLLATTLLILSKFRALVLSRAFNNFGERHVGMSNAGNVSGTGGGLPLDIAPTPSGGGVAEPSQFAPAQVAIFPPLVPQNLSYHIADFKAVPEHDVIRHIASVESGKEGFWNKLRANAQSRLRQALGKEAYADIRKLSVQDRCILCTMLSDALQETDPGLQASSIRALLGQAGSAGQYNRPLQAVARRILAKLVVVPPNTAAPMARDIAPMLVLLANLGNRSALAALKSAGRNNNPMVQAWLKEGMESEKLPPAVGEIMKELLKSGNVWARSEVLRNFAADPDHDVAIMKDLVREGDPWAMAFVRNYALGKVTIELAGETEVDTNGQRKAQEIVIDLVKANNPHGIRLFERLTVLLVAAGEPGNFFEASFYSLLQENDPGMIHVLKNLVLKDLEGAANQVIAMANHGNADLQKFLFQLRLVHPDHPAVARLREALADGDNFIALRQALDSLAGPRKKFTDRAIEKSLGTPAEVALRLAIRDYFSDAGRRRLLEAVRRGEEQAGETLMELHRVGVEAASDDLVNLARVGDQHGIELVARLIHEDDDSDLRSKILRLGEDLALPVRAQLLDMGDAVSIAWVRDQLSQYFAAEEEFRFLASLVALGSAWAEREMIGKIRNEISLAASGAPNLVIEAGLGLAPDADGLSVGSRLLRTLADQGDPWARQYLAAQATAPEVKVEFRTLVRLMADAGNRWAKEVWARVPEPPPPPIEELPPPDVDMEVPPPPPPPDGR